VLDGDQIVFRVTIEATLVAATRGSVVGFQVDRIAADDHTGWSVLAVGQAYEVTDPLRLAALARLQHSPWSPTGVGHTISMLLARVTGRWLVAR
jgi:hypothetical protein